MPRFNTSSFLSHHARKHPVQMNLYFCVQRTIILPILERLGIFPTAFTFIQGMIVNNFLQTRIVNCRDLYSKELINDLKEAATCEVRTVCRKSCHHCPYVLEKIDTEKINVKVLSSYIINLEKAGDEQLLISITAPGIDNWLIKNNLPFITPKGKIRWVNRSSKTGNKFVSQLRMLTYKGA